MYRSLLLFAGLSLFASPLYALDLGDPAPPEISVSTWVKGSPTYLSGGAGKTVYILEFWATWCKPCRDNIPHLSDVQDRFKRKDVTVIAISEEDTTTIQDFVNIYGSKMKYVIAADKASTTNSAYTDVPGFRGIPFSVIVNAKGQVAWYGHPQGGMEEALEKIVNGTYDIALVKKARDAQKLYSKYFKTLASGDEAGAKAIGEQILTDGASDTSFLNEFAWTILTDTRVKKRDLDLASRIAKAAYDGTGGVNSAITDTYARALFDSGDVAGAITYQKKAISTCNDPGLKQDLEDTLARYESVKK